MVLRVSTLASKSCRSKMSRQGFIMPQSLCVYYKLHEKQLIFINRNRMFMWRWPFALHSIKLRRPSRETERVSDKKRCAQACRNLVMSHTTNCQNETWALNLASDRVAQSSQMLSVITLKLAWSLLYQCPMRAVCQASCSEALPYLLSKQASLDSKKLWISHIREQTRSQGSIQTKSSGIRW